MHNFNERIVYDIITEHQSTEHKYNIETSFNNLNFNFGISNDINNINIKIAELHMHEILSRFEDLKALCPDWPCFLYKKKILRWQHCDCNNEFYLKEDLHKAIELP